MRAVRKGTAVRYDRDIEDRASSARMQMHDAIMTAFCNIMQSTRLPPMMVLNYAAMAVGAVYRQAADDHGGPNPCPCGWEPSAAAEIANLQSVLARMALPQQIPDLDAIEAVGRA